MEGASARPSGWTVVPQTAEQTQLRIPLKVTVTRAAADYFMRHNRPLKRIHMADDAEEFGFVAETVDRPLVHRLTMADYLQRLEFVSVDPLEKRNEILELTTQISLSLLYRKFAAEIRSRLLKLPEVEAWNRQNPSAILDEQTRFRETVVNREMSRHSDLIKNLKKSIVRPLVDEINSQSDMDAPDRDADKRLALEYVNNLSSYDWYLLILLRTKLGARPEELIRSVLRTYVRKSTVSEYLPLMVVELVMIGQNTNMVNAGRRIYGEPVQPESIMTNPEMKDAVVAEMHRAGQSLALDWHVSPRRLDPNARQRLTISLYNMEFQMQEFRDSVNRHKNMNLSDHSLKDFFATVGGTAQQSQLGLYYLSCLRSACDDLDIRFDSMVSEVPGKGTAFFSLILQF